MDNPARPGRSEFRHLAGAGDALRLSSLGLQLAFSVVIGFGIGYGLDRVFHTRPWLMIAFLLLGTVAGFAGIFRAVRESRDSCSSKD